MTESTPTKHVPQPLRESVEFAHARIDALQAALAATLGAFSNTESEGYFFQAFQNLDRDLVSKWDAIKPAIRARES